MRTKRHRAGLKINCFGDKFSGVAKSCVRVSLAPGSGQGPSFPFIGYVYQKITAYTASQTRPAELWTHLRDLPLADPDPSSHHSIQVLIGADLYGSLLLPGLRQGPPGTPTAQRTVLGWILSGPTGRNLSASGANLILHCVTCEDTNFLLQKFWEDESVPSAITLSEDDERCEQHFAYAFTRFTRTVCPPLAF